MEGQVKLMVKIGIADDEKEAREQLRSVIAQFEAEHSMASDAEIRALILERCGTNQAAELQILP